MNLTQFAGNTDRHREDLAAVFHMAAFNNWHEGIANHFSLAVSDEGKQFLMNPRWRHFTRIAASDLLLLNADEEMDIDAPGAPDPSAWCIHGAIHRTLPQARCILHVHPPFATALAALQNPEIKPIDQNTARFFNRIAFDMNYGGIAHHTKEGARLASLLGNKRIMVMANHGVLVVGNTVAQAYDDLYYLERACQTMILAYSSGQPLNIMTDDLAEQTASGWDTYSDSAFTHFDEMKQVLIKQGASFLD